MGLEIPPILNVNTVPDAVLKDQGAAPDRVQARVEPLPPLPSGEKLQDQVKTLEATVRAFNHRVKLSVNEEIDQVIIKVVDGDTDKVIREIPAEEIQHLIAKIRETIGVLVDEKI